jgi:hypothetical protein
MMSYAELEFEKGLKSIEGVIAGIDDVNVLSAEARPKIIFKQMCPGLIVSEAKPERGALSESKYPGASRIFPSVILVGSEAKLISSEHPI